MTALDWAGMAVFLAGVVALFFAQNHDVLARTNRAPSASPTSFLIRPLHLFDPELYTAEGNRHRQAALRYLGVFLVTSVVAFMLFSA